MKKNHNNGYTTPAGFGTGPVFLTSLCTILGAILYLRMGYAVANTGFWGTLAIIIIAHLVTFPTAMTIAEIATNQKVAGGGAYFIISRSFGLNIGAAIGMALYLSQAVSEDFKNANLMILLGFIILGHPQWKNGLIKVYSICPENELDAQRQELLNLAKSGRLPISPRHVEVISQSQGVSKPELIAKLSKDAGLTMIGFRAESLKRMGKELFTSVEGIGNIFFVCAAEEKEISELSSGDTPIEYLNSIEKTIEINKGGETA